MRLSTELQGGVHIFAEQRGIRGFRDQVADLVTRAGEVAEAQMLFRVPRSDGDNTNSEGTIADSIRVRTAARFEPGGAGGGGFWRVAVGPGADAPTHLRYVLQGTGIYGPVGNLIRPNRSSFMSFEYQARNFHLSTSKGQRPNRDWIEAGQEAADRHIQAGMRSLRLQS